MVTEVVPSGGDAAAGGQQLPDVNGGPAAIQDEHRCTRTSRTPPRCRDYPACPSWTIPCRALRSAAASKATPTRDHGPPRSEHRLPARDRRGRSHSRPDRSVSGMRRRPTMSRSADPAPRAGLRPGSGRPARLPRGLPARPQACGSLAARRLDGPAGPEPFQCRDRPRPAEATVAETSSQALSFSRPRAARRAVHPADRGLPPGAGHRRQ